MKEVDQVLAELNGRAGLDSKFVVTVVSVHVSKDVDTVDRDSIVEAAGVLKKVVVDTEADFGSLPGILADRGRL